MNETSSREVGHKAATTGRRQVMRTWEGKVRESAKKGNERHGGDRMKRRE